MSSKQKQQISARLLALIEELKQALSDNQDAAKTVELDQTRQGRLSRMDAMQAQAMAKATRQRAAQQLKLAERRLVEISHADFGDCEECGEHINPARLLSNPLCKHCISCAQQLEQ